MEIVFEPDFNAYNLEFGMVAKNDMLGNLVIIVAAYGPLRIVYASDR